MTALPAAALAGLLALAAQTGLWAVVAVVIGVQLLLATGIAASRSSGAVSTSRSGGQHTATWLVVAGSGVAASLAAVNATVVDLGSLAPVAAAAVLISLLREVVRRDGRAGLIESLATTATGALIAVLAAAWSVTVLLPHGPTLVIVGAAGLVTLALVEAVPGPRGLLGPVGVAAAAGLGWVVMPELSGPYAALAGALLAGAAALAGAVALAAASWWSAGTREHVALRATLPLALAGPVVHLMGRLADALT